MQTAHRFNIDEKIVTKGESLNDDDNVEKRRDNPDTTISSEQRTLIIDLFTTDKITNEHLTEVIYYLKQSEWLSLIKS